MATRRVTLAKLVSADWVADQIDKPRVRIIDPRRPMKYLAGHLADAINVPTYKAFGTDGKLLEPAALAQFFGGAGFGDDDPPILYDSPEGQNAAMLTWILEYLGRNDVIVMETFFEGWKAAGREVRYRPVTTSAQKFSARPNPSIRVTVEEIRAQKGLKFVDFRSTEEFSGERTMGSDAAGHIPGAVNLTWRELGKPPEALLKPSAELEQKLHDAGVQRGDLIVAYCRSGPRAALGYLALRQAGYDVRLFDASWAEWSRLGLPAQK
jgi:thiosulfate/3-mercaptopyruvate sulfurtransferase